MPLLGQQPSFCLKITSSLVLFLFQIQGDLTVQKKMLHLASSLLWYLYSSLSISDSVLPFFLVIFWFSFSSLSLSDIQISLSDKGHTSPQPVPLRRCSCWVNQLKSVPSFLWTVLEVQVFRGKAAHWHRWLSLKWVLGSYMGHHSFFEKALGVKHKSCYIFVGFLAALELENLYPVL